jgi:choline-glycine betaine transporter
VGLSLAYFSFRHNLPLKVRSALYPLVGKKIGGVSKSMLTLNEAIIDVKKG